MRFWEHQHEWGDIRLTVIEKTSGDAERKRREMFHISQLATDKPHGLNVEHVLFKLPKKAIGPPPQGDAAPAPESTGNDCVADPNSAS